MKLYEKVYLLLKLHDETRFYLSMKNGSTLLYDCNTGNMHLFTAGESELITATGQDLLNLLRKKSGYANESFFLKIQKIAETKNKISRPEAEERNIIKINPSTVCNMNCTYCFRQKGKTSGLDIKKTEKSIDYVMHVYNPHTDHYSFSFDMTSEALSELNKLKEIKKYIDNQCQPLFRKSEFITKNEAIVYLNCLPDEYSKSIDTADADVNSITEVLNNALHDRELTKKIPLIDGMELPLWELNQYKNVQKLSENELPVFNRRYLESVFPSVYLRKPYSSFFFISNGTLLTDEAVKFIKEIKLNPFCISLDGPPPVHDKHRIYKNGKSTFHDIEKNIKKLHDNGIDFSATAVITPDYPFPLDLAEFFLSIGAVSSDMKPVRAGTPDSFTPETIRTVIEGYEKLFSRYESDFLSGKDNLIKLMKNDMSFTGIKLLLTKHRFTKRCHWNEDLIIDGKGDIYPCDYTIGNQLFKRGSVQNSLLCNVFNDSLVVTERPGCRECWAKYLCGGTCYYSSWISTGTVSKPDQVECIFNKNMREICISFIHNLIINGADLQKLRQILDIADPRIEYNRTFSGSHVLCRTISTSLTGLAVEFKKIQDFLAVRHVKMEKNVLLNIRKSYMTGCNEILDMTVIVPVSESFISEEPYIYVKDFSLGATLSAATISDDKCTDTTERLLLETADMQSIPIRNSVFYLSTESGFLGKKDEPLTIFYKRDPAIF
jgi:radical SAM protein with 4Fe4S-binding SPASM domain